jgi:hypothetical protein
MTVNERIKVFLEGLITAMSMDMQASQCEREVVLLYTHILAILGDICASTFIPPQSDDDELEFIKINEQVADQMWKIFKDNLTRVGSDLVNDTKFDSTNPAEGFRQKRMFGNSLYMMKPAKMVQ